MKTKKKTSKLIAYLGMLSVALSVFLCPTDSIAAQAAAPRADVVMPCSDNIDYCFYIVGNKIYKQLYNYTKKVWVGDPIYVGEVP